MLLILNSFVIQYILRVVKCDWVEITRFENIPSQPGITESSRLHFTQRPRDPFLSTTSVYEYFMKTPIMPNEVTTVPTKAEKIFISKRIDTRFGINNNKNVLNMQNNKRNNTNFGKEKLENQAEYTLSNGSFINYMGSIQDGLVKKAHKTLKNKIDLLKDLRDTLLRNIDERISNFGPNINRKARTYSNDHEMEYPSNEGALMTIGFLTFAVYLIKLVLKLIHALKDKHNTTTTTMMPMTMAMMGRKKRETFEEHDRILQLIEEYNFT